MFTLYDLNYRLVKQPTEEAEVKDTRSLGQVVLTRAMNIAVRAKVL